MADSDLDPESILERLRAEQQILQWQPLPPNPQRGAQGGEQTRSRGSLEFLHGNWALPDHYDRAVSGGGFRGRVIDMFGRLTFRVLGPYFRQEREVIAHLVRVNEALERRCDELTMRCQQLNQDFLDRQVAESRNLTELALWLHLDHPASDDRGTPAP